MKNSRNAKPIRKKNKMTGKKRRKLSNSVTWSPHKTAEVATGGSCGRERTRDRPHAAATAFTRSIMGPPLERRTVVRFPAVRFYQASDPNGIRTRVTAVKGRCPRPLDDR